MSESPYAPPASHVADRVAPAPPRPKRVTLAVWLLWISFALGFPELYLVATREPDAGITFNVVAVGLTLIIMVFSGVLIFLISRGRNWARITLLVLTLVGIPFLLMPSDAPESPLERGLSFLDTALDLVAMYLLFTRPGSPWFRRREE